KSRRACPDAKYQQSGVCSSQHGPGDLVVRYLDGLHRDCRGGDEHSAVRLRDQLRWHRYYGLRRLAPKGTPFGAVARVLGTVIQMLEGGATHIGVATDHIIESFRNELWPGYKTGLGIEPALYAQFVPLEEALVAMGVATWPMVELEADDALASAACIAA